MNLTVLIFALVALAGCGRQSPPPATPANSNDSSVALKLDVDKGAIGFKKQEGGGGDSLDVEVKTK
jgi:predicted small lipoprotein YifL